MALDLLHQPAARHRGPVRRGRSSASPGQAGAAQDRLGQRGLPLGRRHVHHLAHDLGRLRYCLGFARHHRHRAPRPRDAGPRCASSRNKGIQEPIIPLWLFKNRTFTATSGVGFIIGFAMFGAVIYLPLYLQVVHGASPTLSGLELLPLIGGMLITFITSGRIVTRTGRYKVFPIVGTGVLTVGLLSLTELGPHTTYGEVAVFMFITGFGIGLVMQVLVVAVQNTVPYSALGVATATATFFRTMGKGSGWPSSVPSSPTAWSHNSSCTPARPS